MPDPDIAEAINKVEAALRSLGTADAISPFGAIEGLTVYAKEGMGELAYSLDRLTTAVEEGLADVAKAIRQTGPE